MWAPPVGVPPVPRPGPGPAPVSKYGPAVTCALDAAYGLEPVGVPGCALCDAWTATREAAREGRDRHVVREANTELNRHPDHHTWPAEGALG